MSGDVDHEQACCSKRSRPDKRDALLNREFEVKHAVKCGLATRIHNPSLREHLVKALSQRVAQVSQAKHAAGIMFNDILIRCCASGGPALPTIDQSFMRRLLLREGSHCPVIQEVCERYDCLAPPQRFQGDGQTYSSTARELLTEGSNEKVINSDHSRPACAAPSRAGRPCWQPPGLQASAAPPAWVIP